MWKPYRVVVEGPGHARYTYSTICSWWLYATIALLIGATVLEQQLLSWPAVAGRPQTQ